MSDASESTSADGLLFPAFMYGDRTTCRRKMKAEAKKWAKCYLEGRDFPEPKLVPVPPGSVVFMDENTAHWVGNGYSSQPHSNVVTIGANPKEHGLHIQWRAYMLDYLQFEAKQAAHVAHAERFTFYRVFIQNVCRYPWGAISAIVIDCLLNGIKFTAPRIEGVLRFWEALDTLRYVDFDERPVRLAEFLGIRFRGQLAMWVDHPTGNIRADLQTAIDQMRNASADEIHRRLIKRLREYVDNDKELKHLEWLKSPGVIETGLEAERRQGQELYDNLTSGGSGEHGSFLTLLVRDHAPTVH